MTNETVLEDGWSSAALSSPRPADPFVSTGTLVWARQIGYPWYPAEVADLKAADTPQWLKDNAPAKGANKAVAVLFFDEKRSGCVPAATLLLTTAVLTLARSAWIDRPHLRLLGESKDFDQLLLYPSAIRATRKKDAPKSKTIGSTLEKIVRFEPSPRAWYILA